MRYSRSPILSMPVTLAEAKAHCRVMHDDEDWLVQRYLLAAAHEIEVHCEIALTRQTISLTVEVDGEPICLPVGPLAPDAVVTVNGTGTSEGIEGGRYPRLTLAPAITGTVQITYEAGFGDTSDDLPDDLQLAVMEQAAHAYDHRADPEAKPGLTPAAARICARHRRVAL
ncbi:MAG: head-tail connector protein [Hyphomicrobiaceae bacterium]